MYRAGTQLLVLSVLVFSACATAAPPEAPPADPAYLASIEEFRSDRVERLRAEDGWLTLTGLYWLEPGANPIGASAGLAVVLPEPAPAQAGVLEYDGDSVRLVPEEGVEFRIGDEIVSEPRQLQPDDPGPRDLVTLGETTFYVLMRNDRHGIRVKDPNAETRRNFTGIDFFDVDTAFRVTGSFAPFDEPVEVTVPTVAGTTSSMLAPGEIDFEVDGKRQSLRPLVSNPDDTGFFIIFRDQTSGKSTYGAARYLQAELVGDTVELDFNRAYNPPCAFTKFATCPLPPPENLLQVAIEAGEKKYEGLH